MTEISTERSVNIESLLSDYDVLIDGSKPLMMINPEPDEIKDVYQKLKENENHYQVFYKEELPKSFQLHRHPFIFPILLVADIGWSLVTDKWLKSMYKYSTKGNHGL